MDLTSGLLIGGAAFTGIGAIHGAGIKSNADQNSENVGRNSAIGAVAGASVFGVIAGASFAGAQLTKNDFALAKKIGSATADIAGDVAATTGNFAVGAAKGTVKTTGGLIAGIGKSLSDKFLEINPKNKNIFGGLSLKKNLGTKAALVGIGLGMILNEGFEVNNEIDKGVPMGAATSTPEIDNTWQSMDNYQSRSAEAYGAGGELVFALNANRRGRRF